MKSGGVSARIREKRKEQRLTQQELADKVGVSLMTVLRWEKGERTPNTSIMESLARALGTTVTYLMGLDSAGEELPDKETSPTRITDAETQTMPNMAYWGSVADNARNVAEYGNDNDIADVTQMLKRALALLSLRNQAPVPAV